MSRSIAAAAPRLYAVAAQALGWRPADFWAATPAELHDALASPGGSESGAAMTRSDLETLIESETHGRHD